MKIVIPTAGFGTRLRPHTWSRPKPLICVAGKPVLAHVLDKFFQLPVIDELVFIVGYLGDQIEAYVQEAYPHLKTRYVVQEELIGQSHAIWLAREGLTGPVLIAFVDTLIETDLSTLPDEKADAVIWVKEVPDPRRFGVAEVGDDGWVRRLIEKPEDMSNNLAVVGFYYLKKAEKLIEAIEEQMERQTQLKGEFFIADAFNILLEAGLKMRVQPVEVWNDCGKPDAVLETNRYLLDHGHNNASDLADLEGVAIVPPVFIDPTAKVEQSVIGPYASIGPGCVIQRCLIQDSIIESGAQVTNSALNQSLIGEGAQVVGKVASLNVGDTSEVNQL
jgi:glucose-1-phosphate thymidylyltransferase